MLGRLLAVLLVASLLLGGCLGSPDADAGDRGTTSKYWGAPVEDRLTITNDGDGRYAVSIRIVNESDGAVIYDRNRTLAVGESVAPNEVFHGYHTYGVTVRVNGSAVFDRSVSAAGSYDVEIRSGTDVTVTGSVV